MWEHRCASNLARDDRTFAGDASKHGGVSVVGCRVIDIIESPDEMDFFPAELGFEGGEIPPRVVRFVGRSNPPQVVPLMAQRLGFAHDLEMKKVGGHHVAANVA